MKRIIGVLLAAVLVTACGISSAAPGPAENVTMKGHVSDVRAESAGDVLGTIRVEGAKVDPVIQRAIVTITNQTQVVRVEGGQRIAVGLDSLQFGQLVAVTFAGAVMESDPVQGTAAEIVILATMPTQ